MTKLLAIDNSTEACSVALYRDGECIEEFALTPREHTKRLLPMVDKVLAESGCGLKQLDAIAYGAGPGSFTGLRICLGAVQGLAFAAELPVIGISSLAALAQTALMEDLVDEQEYVMSVIDARMDEVYWGLYRFEEGLAVSVHEDSLSSPEAISFTVQQTCAGIGSGMNYQSRFALDHEFKLVDKAVLPSAAAVALLAAREFKQGRVIPADQAAPVYLRDEVAWQKQV